MMFLSALLAVALCGQTAEPVKGWHFADLDGVTTEVWGYPVETKDGPKIRIIKAEQEEARRKHPHYVTGVDPNKLAEDNKPSRASDEETREFGDALKNHKAHDASKPCPNGPNGPCPNKPKPDEKNGQDGLLAKKYEETRNTYILAGIALIIGTVLIIGGSRERHSN